MALVRVLALVIAILLLAVPVELPGCGWAPPKALFTLKRQPERPMAEFAHGQLGVLQPTYDREYLVIAYRYLAGVGLSDKEREAVFSPAQTAAGDPSEWNTARAQVAVPAVKPIVAYRDVNQSGYLTIALNCGTDAFHTAAATLADRSRRFGADSPLLVDWVRAQDTVFSNCNKGESIPEPAEDARLRADREYQTAAAKFYARHFEEARADFERIARDAESPWREGAPYLAARCLIREEKFGEADAALGRVIADPSLTAWHGRAQRLRNFVALRTRPRERLDEVAHALVRPNSEHSIGQDLIDYCRPYNDQEWPREDDLSDWIATFAAGKHEHALDRWRTTHSIPWLVAALPGAKPADADAAALLAAARAVPRESPAYVTATYYSLALLPKNQVRITAGQLLRVKMPSSARNLVVASRLPLARDLNEFLRDAPQRAVGESGIDGDQPVSESRSFLGYEAAEVLNSGVPLSALKQASESKQLPENIRRELGRVAFARSVVLADSPDFDGILTLLRSPGISPWVGGGYGRLNFSFHAAGVVDIGPTQLESYGHNWWSSRKQAGQDHGKTAGFLSPEDRRAAAAEWKRLRELPLGVDWLGRQTLAFAAAHPADPRVPEALHRVVRASRYSVTDAATGDISKRAFLLLHRRYPKSEWTKKTPYWFG